MATGIVSRAVRSEGSARLSGILLVLTIVFSAVLVVAYGWRLAGAQILLLPANPLQTATRPVLAGTCVVLWAFGTWLIPFLLGIGAWRHLIRKVRLRYEPALWSLVFPVGMYGAASRELGKALHVSWLATLGSDEAWLALAVWVVVFPGMLGSFLSPLLRVPDRGRAGAAGRP